MKSELSSRLNRGIYMKDEGMRLMQPAFFTEEVLSFHSSEKLFCKVITHKYDHRLIVEIGCGNFRLIDTKPQGCYYLGVDIYSPSATRIPAKKGAIIRCDAQKFFANSRIKYNITRLFGDRVVCILPFNFLGTMDEPVSFLDSVSLWNRDIILSLFNANERATEARIRYYNGCGIDVEQVTTTEAFVKLNCSNGFEAFAFSQTYIEALLERSGYCLTRKEAHDIFTFMFFQRRQL